MSSPSRSCGAVDPPFAAGLHDHACWEYTSKSDRGAAAASWLVDGLKAGQRAVYVGDGPSAKHRAELSEWLDVAGLAGRGALMVFGMEDLYDLSRPIDAEQQLAVYAGAVDQALADGYAGIRVAADITPLVEDPDRRPSHLRWEQIADRYIASHPLTPLCLYDGRRVGHLESIGAVHPQSGPVASPFAVYGDPDGVGRSCLAGEVDLVAEAVFAEVLAGLPPTDAEVDVTHLRFIDGRSLWVLHEALQRRRAAGHPTVVRGVHGVTGQAWRELGFDPALMAG